MDGLREWAIALCAAAVLCAAAEMIAPSDKNGKGIRVIAAGVMLCAVILPLSRMDCSGFRDITLGAEAFEPDTRLCAAIEQQTADAVSGTVESLVSDCLRRLGVEWEDISVVMDISEDGCISIGQITVRTAAGQTVSQEETESELYSRLGLSAEVITAEESQWNSLQ
ncbi:MAG: hypothetical protein E7554_07770 [Ruminococcaceae bacterium]|nr:hypothetical protein [Oscillospiraceae bacterium]